jgi:hypothetical protein
MQPRDLFAERGINVDAPRDLFAERGINPAQAQPFTPDQPTEMVDTFLGKMPKPSKNMNENLSRMGIGIPQTPEEKAKLDQILHERRMGALQSLANYPIEIANLFKKEPFQKFDFAPKTKEAQTGQIVGDIGSFFLPGGALKTGLKGLSYVPKIGEAINAMTKGIDAVPWLKSLMNVGKAGGEAALYNAAKNPQNAQESALEGGALGGGTQAAVNLLTTTNPLVRTLARMGVGAGIGYPFGHPGYGALAGAAYPQLASMVGLTGKNAIPAELLEGLSSKDVARAKAANDRLNTVITPAQASGNYVTSGLEGNLKRSPQGAQYAYRQEQLQTRQQRQAINKMLDNIYTPTPQKEANINALYAKAGQMDINPLVVKQMRTNPIMESAFKTVKSDPAFTNIPENNYKFLAEVDRQLYRDYNAALGNRPNSANAINSTKNSFNSFLKQANPDYEAATKAAQPKMVRENIEGRFNKNEEDFTGKNFYSKFLNTKKSYEDVLRDTKNFPEAQQALKDMRAGWKHLSNIKTVSQGEAQAKTGLADARDQLKVIWNAMKKIAGAKSDIQGLKYVYSKDWDKDFTRIMQVKEQAARNRELATLLGKMSVAAGLRPNE